MNTDTEMTWKQESMAIGLDAFVLCLPASVAGQFFLFGEVRKCD
jgi:hypothetical protein